MTATARTSGPAKQAGREVEMTLLEHLADLRRGILHALLAVAVAGVATWFFYDSAVAFMLRPYCASIKHRHVLGSCALVTTAPIEGLTSRLKVVGYLAAVAASPVWLWEIWKFITPALHRHERKYALGFLASATALFWGGAATAVAVFPRAISWLTAIGGERVEPLFSPGAYFGLYATCCLVFGLVFTFPVVLVFLQVVGVVPSSALRRSRRQAYVVLLVVAAVITPSGDPISFFAMAVPMVAFYEGAIVAGRILGR